MAANPTFLSQFKTQITSSGNLVFQPNKNSRIYNVYCRNSSGAGTTKIEIGTPSEGSPNVLNANVDINFRYEFFNSGISKVQFNGTGSLDGKWFETFKVGGTINYEDINIELEGTFPLVNETTFQYNLNIPGNGPETRSQTFAASTTAQAIADAIILDVLSRREVGFFNGASYTANTINIPQIQFVKTTNFGSNVEQINLSATKELTNRPSDLSLFTKSNVGLKFTYVYTESPVDGVSVPNIALGKFTITPSRISAPNQPADMRFVPHPFDFDKFSVWASTTSDNDNNGETGTEADPYVLNSDLKSKLLNLFQNGNTVSSSAGLQEFTSSVLAFVASENIPSLPKLVTKDFAAAAEDIELISDVAVNPIVLTDVHGNKFFPVQAGQRIVIDAPQAESIILVYGEE